MDSGCFYSIQYLSTRSRRPTHQHLHLSTAPVDSTPSIAFGLPLRLLDVLAMVTSATIKSIYWVSYISNEEMPVSNALKVSVFEIFFSSTNSILSLPNYHPIVSQQHFYYWGMLSDGTLKSPRRRRESLSRITRKSKWSSTRKGCLGSQDT
jgi:hypothetical protein